MMGNYYMGYFLNQPICASVTPKPIRKYMTNNRKLSEDSFDILPAYGDINKVSVDQEDIFLVKYRGTYVTARELRIIVRDWKSFIDRCIDTIENLKELDKYTRGEHLSITKVIDLCDSVIDTADTCSSPTFERFFQCHHLVNMSMATYSAYVSRYAEYYEEVYQNGYFRDEFNKLNKVDIE